MECKIDYAVSVVITLSLEEALWLKYLMQNPIDAGDPVDERKLDKRMRKTFWSALQEVEDV